MRNTPNPGPEREQFEKTKGRSVSAPAPGFKTNRRGLGGAAAGAAAVAERAPVSLTLEFRDGRTWLGPFTLAPAPRLF